MNERENDECVLTLNHLVFDKITFQRQGFSNKSRPRFKFGFNFEVQEDQKFVVHIDVYGEKVKEYEFEVAASGYFTLNSSTNQDLIMRQNAAAIIFPYIRSQISLLTAQPEMTPIILPPLNIAQLVEDAMKKDG